MIKKITLLSIILFTGIILAIYAIGFLSLDKQQNSYKNINQQLNQYKTIVKNDVSVYEIKDIKDILAKQNIKSNIENINTNKQKLFTINKVALHSSVNDCYLIINKKVYDVSSYISYHPGGVRNIISRCGKDVTGIFAVIHSNFAWDLLKKYYVGNITFESDTPNTKANNILQVFKTALKQANPGAEIINIRPKKNFYIAKLIYKGKLYEIHLDLNGEILKQEIENDDYNWSLWDKDSDDI